MVNPGSFQGTRGDFLLAQRGLYATAVKDGHIADTVADIQRRYFKRFPISLRDDEEPSDEWLANVDDSAPSEDIPVPDIEGLEKEAADQAMQSYSDTISRIKFKKEQIKRRMHYLHAKSRAAEVNLDKTGKDPISSITSKLLGVDIKLPRRKTTYNVWGPQHRSEVDPVFDKRISELKAPKEQHAAIRSAIFKELFEALPSAEQEKWAGIADREHEKACIDARKKFKDSIPSSPMDRQRVIASLPKFIEPILDAIVQYTGWKATFIAGGPEPADNGRLNVISIHSGVTMGPVKMDFGRAQKSDFKRHIAPAFGSFLKKCYTVRECREGALPKDYACVSISDIAADEEISMQVHTFELDEEHEKAHRPIEDIAKSGKRAVTNRASSSTSSNPPHRAGSSASKKNKKVRVPPVKDSSKVKLGPSPLQQSFVAEQLPLSQNPSVKATDRPAPSSSSTVTSSGAIGPAAALAASTTATSTSTSKDDTSTDAASSKIHDVAKGISSSSGAASAPVPRTTITSEDVRARPEAPSATSTGVTKEVSSGGGGDSMPSMGTTTTSYNASHNSSAAGPATLASAGGTNGTTLGAASTTSTSAPQGISNPDANGTADVPSAIGADVMKNGIISAGAASEPSTSTTTLKDGSDLSRPSATSTGSGSAEADLSDSAGLGGTSAIFTSTSGEAAADLSGCTGLGEASANAGAASTPLISATATTLKDPSGVAESAAVPATSAGKAQAESPVTPPVSLPPSPQRTPPPRTSLKFGGAATVPNASDIEDTPVKGRKRKASQRGKENSSEQAAKRVKESAPSAAKKRKAGADVSGTPSKKQRVGDDHSFSITLPDGCPPWVTNALDLLTARDLGPQWRSLVEAWLAFEQGHAFDEKKRPALPPNGRPAVVGDWIKRARQSSWRPDIGNLDKFSAAFEAWWVRLQPHWRVVDGALRREVASDNNSWDCLRCSGVNGLLSVLAALFYWGYAAVDTPSAPAWATAVDDVLYAVQELLKDV